ncbi:MAG: CDP-alcohol phosphatidyltransferase family protein [Planctomycetes bacterium]|nr:CDP-alcohol phosphatidyltransferase family protein [Planctomycetota bacterium]
MPNLLTVARIAGSGALLYLAHAGHASWFIALFAVLMFTDWLDGKIAIWLDQRTVLGARLDSFGDVVSYVCLLIGVAWLRPEFVSAETPLIAAMLGSYALSVIVTLIRFRRLPAYHTRAAKTCWLLAAIGAITLLADGPWWPARVTMIAVIITNIEAVAISLVLREWRTDIPWIVSAVRRRRKD